MIWLGGFLVAALAVLGLGIPWWWPAFTRRAALKRRTANVAAYKGRLQELDADVSAGVVPRDAVEATKQELASRLVDDAAAPAAAPLALKPSRAVLIASALALLAFAGAWYALAGSWHTQQLIELARTNPELARTTAVDDMIRRLQDRVADNPDDADTWAWLARSYRGRGRHADAAEAFARASALKGHQDPDLLVEEGESRAFAQDRSMAGVPAERFAQALALAPDHTQALWYGGIAALQAGDDRTAIARWERLARQSLPEDLRATLDHSLARLRERHGLPAAPPAAAAALVLNVEVSVAPDLAAAVQPGDTVFVFAQDPSGPPMPVAARRLSAAQWPLRTTLDDSSSPMPTRKLSGLDRWLIVARVSKSGRANPEPGDLQGQVEVARSGAGKPVKVVIDQRRP